MDGRSDDGASQTGSQASGASARSAKATQLAGVLQSSSVFPLLQQLEWPALPIQLSTLGMVLEGVQPLGLVINTRFSWSYIVENQIAYLVYFLHLPVWDETWAGSSAAYAAIAFFWILVALGGGIVAATTLWVLGGEQQGQASARTMVVVRAVIHSLPSVVFFPLMHLLFAPMMCNTDTDKMMWYTDYDCWGPFHLVHMLVGILMTIIYFVFTDFVATTLFDDNPNSRVLTARASSSFSELAILYKFALVAVYHATFAYGKEKYFPLIMAILSVIISVSVAYYLPYYNFTVNKVRSGAYLMAAYVAMLAAIEPSQSSSLWYGTNLSTILLALGTPVAFALGYFVPYARVPLRFLRSLSDMKRGIPLGQRSYV
eukprot:PhM_4_TR16795/c0_g1_i2/m.50619